MSAMNRSRFGSLKPMRSLAVLSLAALLWACTTPPAEQKQAAAAPPPVQPVPFDEAVLKAANDLFSRAQLPEANAKEPAPYTLVIDPLIDGVSGAQSVATRSMEARLVELVKAKYPRFAVQPFSTAAVAKSPIVLVGTFTGVNKDGKTEGAREAFRVCLALADLKSGKIIAKGTARAKPEGVDITPTAYFNDSPTWTPDPATEAYIKTCQGTKAGDPINAAYADRIVTAALISEAIDAYNDRQYQRALGLYQDALRSPDGQQLRVYNGLYLSSWKLGRRNDATQAFDKIVDYGLSNKRLAVKFLFKPGSTDFWPDRQVSGPYPLWLRQIAQRTSERAGCLEVVGHTSRTGPEPINERLSLRRAESIKGKLENDATALRNRTIANGVGSKETLIGTGTDDARDALDRRVEFKVVDCRAPG
ncbi:MAG: OmpA family protein [Candidatus Competibacteraceae bacterium]|nr:OmpA family protein [Candidatus Competibacteraceae bacterium]MBK8897896.1 OmpA family protein [Candidatus Competibacteraceae bacterium]